MKTNFLLITLLFIVWLTGCSKKTDLPAAGTPTPTPAAQTIDNMQVSPDFIFNTYADVDLQITTLDNADNPVPAIRINIYTDYPENGGNLVMSFNTGIDGIYNGNLKIPAYADSVVLETDAIGFVQLQKRKITNNTLHCVFGGKTPVSNGFAGIAETHGLVPPPALTGFTAAIPYIKTLSTFNSAGVPSNLTIPNDVVDASFLSDINAALPEWRPVPNNHPEYLLPNAQTNLVFQQPSQVWVTFLHEGASYRNVLCYYKYQANNPPATAADIDTLYAIFPNVSFLNSGGGLVTGNKVQIGTFQPGMAVGWAIIANGYNGSSITGGNGIYYSQASLNPEVNPNLKKHCILLNDINRGKLLLSFEDINREGSCDNDFNDAIFYVTANPIQSVSQANIAVPAYAVVDTDHDGVPDNLDDYPQDATKAFNNYYPAQNSNGTLAFEDLWPSKGDYDFNDLVVDYNFNPITNAQNKVVQIKAAIIIKAIGASYHSGFGIQLPIAPGLVSSVTGTDVRGTLISNSANGTEAGQSKATIIAFDDAFNELPWPGVGTGVNTTAGLTYVQPKTLNIVINLTTPVTLSQLGSAPYNSFIFTNKIRANEVHLINQPPTNLANLSLLGTQQDNSNPSAGRYYVTSKNLPFAVNFSAPFDYPVEKGVITDTYLKFYQWGTSSGTQYKDWFKPQTGYRNQPNIFTH